jgi:hypothetical protein
VHEERPLRIRVVAPEQAEPDPDGGYRFTGTKSTSSMAPA